MNTENIILVKKYTYIHTHTQLRAGTIMTLSYTLNIITGDKIVKNSMEDSSRLEAEVMIWKGYPAHLREPEFTSSLKYKPVKGT